MFVLLSVAQDTRGAGHNQISQLFRNLFYNLTIGKLSIHRLQWWRIWILKYWNVCWWVATGGAGWVNATNEPCSVNLFSRLTLFSLMQGSKFPQFQFVATRYSALLIKSSQ